MWTLLLIFACKRSKYANTGGGGSKNGKILRTFFMDDPLAKPPKYEGITYVYSYLIFERCSLFKGVAFSIQGISRLYPRVRHGVSIPYLGFYVIVKFINSVQYF